MIHLLFAILQLFASFKNARAVQDYFRDYKYVALVLAEPVLKDLKIDENHKLEGEDFIFATDKTSKFIDEIAEANEELKKLSASMARGAKFMSEIRNLFLVLVSQWDPKLNRLHDTLIEWLESGEEVFLPASWIKGQSGHAIGISLKLLNADKNKFDLRVFNLGEGADYHKTVPDPKNLYTQLHKPWVYYAGIPLEQLKESPWFVYVLASLYHPLKVNVDESLDRAKYFYDELLAQFEEYQVDENDGKNGGDPIYMIAQRSGTCTITSLVARLALSFSTEEELATFRLKLGLYVVKDWMNSYVNVKEPMKSNAKLLNMMQSFPMIRKLTQYFTSSLANLAISAVADRKSVLSTNSLLSPKAKFSNEQFKLLLETAKVSKDLLMWLRAIPLKEELFTMNEKSFPKFSGTPNYSTLWRKLPFSTFDLSFLKKHGESLEAKENHCIISPIKAKTTHEVLKLLKITANPQCDEFLVPNLMAISKSFEIDKIKLRKRDYYKWMQNYFKLLVKLKRRDMKYIDLYLPYFKLSYLSWKFGQLLDAENGKYKLNLNQFYSPFLKICSEEQYARLQNYRNSVNFQRNAMLISNDLEFEWTKTCNSVKNSQAEQEQHEFLKYSDYFPSAEKYKVSEKFLNKYPDRPEFKIFEKLIAEPEVLMYQRRYRLVKDPEQLSHWAIVARNLPGLTVKYRPFYDAIALWMISNNFFEIGEVTYEESKNTPIGLKLTVSEYDIGEAAVYLSVSNQRKIHATNPLESLLKQDDYSDKLSADLNFLDNGVGVEQVANIFEEATDLSVFKDAEVISALDFLLVSSRRIHKKIDIRPEFAEEIITSMSKLFNHISRKLKIKVFDQQKDHSKTGAELDSLLEFSALFTRTLSAIHTQHKTVSAITEAKAIYDYWISLVGLNDTRVRVRKFIITDAQFSRIHFFLAYEMALFKDTSEFGQTFNEIEFIPRFLSHHLAGRFNFKLSEGSILDKIYNSKVLDSLSNEFLRNRERIDAAKLQGFLQVYIKDVVSDVLSVSPAKEASKSATILKYNLQMNNGQKKKLEIYLPMADIYLNGSQFFPVSRITNEWEFSTFFKYDLETAYSGKFMTAPSGVHSIYSISDFRVKGSQYICIIQNFKLRIYRFVQDEWWLIPENPGEIYRFPLEFRFGLFNSKAYQLYIHKSDVSSVMWIENNSNEYTYKVAPTGMFRFGLYIKGITDNRVLPQYWLESSKLPIPLQIFLEKTPFIVLSRSDGAKIIFIQLFGFKNADGSTSPLAISVKNNVYTVLNYPSMTLANLQLLKDGTSLNGLLVDIKDSDSSTRQMYIMADYSYRHIRDIDMANIWKNIDSYKGTNYDTLLYSANLSLVPVYDGKLQPISRYDRILSAYHSCFSWNFKMGIDWVGQDGISRVESFNDQELALIDLILSEPTVYPEALAIKAALFAQTVLLRGYTSKKPEYDTNVSPLELKGTPSGLFNQYVNLVPDISEKFHIHLMFPEILDLSLFSKLSGGIIERTIYQSEIINGGDGGDTIPKSDSGRNLQDLKSISGYRLFAASHHGLRFCERTLMLIYNSYKENTISLIEAKKILSIIIRTRNPLKNKSLLFDYSRCFYHIMETSTVTRINSVTDLKKECQQFLKCKTRIRRSKGFTGIREILQNYEKAFSEKFETTRRLVQPAAYLNTEIVGLEDINTFKKAAETLAGLYLLPDQEKIAACSRKTSSNVFTELCESMAASDDTLKVLRDLKDESPNLLDDFISKLEERIAELTTRKAYLKQQLTTLSSEGRLSSNGNDKLSVYRTIFMLFHGKKEQDFDNLKRCYFSNNLNCFAKKFPAFSDNNDKLQELHQLSFDYFGTENLIRYFENVKASAIKIKSKLEMKDFAEADNAIKALQDEMAKIQYMNDRLQHPGMLAYEYSSKNIHLRQEQYEDALELAKHEGQDGPFKSTVIQRMMAAGKTIVLGTIASALKADGKYLSILVPPASLYQSNAVSMLDRTLRYFKVRGKTIHFDRFSFEVTKLSDTFAKLELILNQLKTALNTQSYYVANPSELSAFHNNFVEAILVYQEYIETGRSEEDVQKLFRCLQVLKDIYGLFREKGSIILDEIDLTMAPNLELNYPTKETERINMDAARLTADLILFAAHDKSFAETFKLGILTNEQNNFDWIRKRNNVIKAWIDYVITQLEDENSLWSKILLPKILRQEEGFCLESYLTKIRYVLEEPKENFQAPKWLLGWHNSKSVFDNNRFNVLLIMRMQINHWLPDAMSVAAFERYGPSIENWKTIKYAIPYSAAKTPNEGSVFADRWETLNKTLIMYLLKLFKESEITQAILATVEAVSKSEINADTLSKSFEECIGVTLDKVRVASRKLQIRDREGRLINLKAIFNNDRKKPCVNVLKFNHVLKRIFELLDFNVEQITSNALNMASLFKSVQGYSGTIDNINTLPLQLVRQGYQQRLKNEKNNGAIARKLLKQDPRTISVVNFGSGLKIDDFFKGLFSGIADTQEFHAIIDVGAYFKEFRNFEVAKAAVQNLPHIEAAVFYDEVSNQLHYVKKSNLAATLLATSDPDAIYAITGVPVEKRFTFYDQRHITGSDILQKRGAKALLTIGPKVLLRDILQGTMRLRQFMTNQSVQFILTEAVSKLVRFKTNLSKDEQIKIENILLLSSINEDEKQESENKRLAFAKIDDIIRTEVLEIFADMISKNDLKRNSQAINTVRSLFVRTTKETPADWIDKIVQVPTEDVLKEYVKRRLELFKSAFPDEKQRKSNLKGKLENLCAPAQASSAEREKLRHYLPDILAVRSSGTPAQSQGVELRLQLKIEVDMELQLEMISVTKSSNQEPFIMGISPNLLVEFLERPKFDYFQTISETLNTLCEKSQEIIRPVADLFSDFSFTLDLVKPASKSGRRHLIDNLSQEGLALAFVRNQYKWKLILLSSQALESFFKYTDEDLFRKNSYIWVTDLAGRSVQKGLKYSDGKELFEDEIFRTEDVQRAYLHALLVNLSFDHIFSNPSLRVQFAKWIRLSDLEGADRFSLSQKLDLLSERFYFIAHRLKAFGKEKLIYPAHPFIKYVNKISQRQIEYYMDLLKLFPEIASNEALEYLKTFNYNMNSRENIWKFIPEMKTSRLEDFSAEIHDRDDDMEKAVENSDSIIDKNPVEYPYVIKSQISFYFRPYYLVVYFAVSGLAALSFYLLHKRKNLKPEDLVNLAASDESTEQSVAEQNSNNESGEIVECSEAESMSSEPELENETENSVYDE